MVSQSEQRNITAFVTASMRCAASNPSCPPICLGPARHFLHIAITLPPWIAEVCALRMRLPGLFGRGDAGLRWRGLDLRGLQIALEQHGRADRDGDGDRAEDDRDGEVLWRARMFR